MTLDEFVPFREWEPEIGEQVVEWRDPERVGTVIRCAGFGHFADPYWRADVQWPGGGIGRSIETSNLTRPDGSQGAR